MKSRSRRIECVAVALVTYPVRSGLMILAGVATVIGCGFSLVTDHSVRFNSFRSGRGFYRLPPLPVMYDSLTGKEVTVVESISNTFIEDIEPDYKLEAAEQTISEIETTWEQARSVIAEGDLGKAEKLLRRFLDITEQPRFYEPEQRQQWRNSARDMLDAMSALRKGSSSRAVQAYLNARSAYDLDAASEDSVNLLTETPADKELEDNFAYLRAAALYKTEKKDDARAAFNNHVTKFPRSEKRESSLYMAAKLRMEASHSFQNEGCGIEGVDVYGEPIDEASVQPKEQCQDEDWLEAVGAFQELMLRYPNGRYFDDSRGWLAYLYRRGGERAKSLAEYYRLLGHPTSWNARIEAKKSLQMIGHRYDDATLDQIEALIGAEANAAMAYAYHRIYNHAVDLNDEKEEDCCWLDDDRWQREYEEKQRVKKAHGAGKHELERVTRFATAMMKRHPHSRVSGGFVVRVAEAQFELQNYDQALALARKSLSLGVQGDLRTQALWIKGSSEHQRRELTAARATFNQLSLEFPNSKLTEGARRLLAMTAEDQGDLETALENYIALKYDYDVAYLVDVLLPVDRLAKFVEKRKGRPEYDKLLYSVGVRYLREKRWNDARSTLARVSTRYAPPATAVVEWSTREERPAYAKTPEYESPEDTRVNANWVAQDLKTIDVLEHLEHAVEIAPDDETRAEAMYQLASFHFDADDLLFYNPAVWEGGRYMTLDHIQTRLPNEERILFDYSQEHETLSRAIPIYVDIAAQFPQTRAARDALYSAAVAHERLSNLNNYWRGVYGQGLFAGPRHVSYADVKSRYPGYQLPRGTFRWEASTRTVNGGPGWAAPEKPKPRETREQKIKRLLREFKAELSEASTKLSSSIKPRVEGGISWYGSMIEAAIYGILSGIGLWALILIGVNLHLRRIVPQTIGLSEDEPPPGADSRVDKIIE